MQVIGTVDGNGGTHFSGETVSPSWLLSCLNFKLFHWSQEKKKVDVELVSVQDVRRCGPRDFLRLRGKQCTSLGFQLLYRQL